MLMPRLLSARMTWPKLFEEWVLVQTDSVNVSFNEMIAIVTSVQQTTARGGNVIGNSLKTILLEFSVLK